MEIYFEKIEEFSQKRVDYYTVRIDENEFTEFELFINQDFPEHETEIQIMYAVIEAMQSKGAKLYYFKDESEANAIPRVSQVIIDANKKDYGIRLYCIRLTDELVVLLNGGIKTNPKPQLCDNVKRHFSNAIKIGRKLNSLLEEGEINFLYPNCLEDLQIEI